MAEGGLLAEDGRGWGRAAQGWIQPEEGESLLLTRLTDEFEVLQPYVILTTTDAVPMIPLTALGALKQLPRLSSATKAVLLRKVAVIHVIGVHCVFRRAIIYSTWTCEE